MRPLIGITTYGELASFGRNESYAAVLPMSYVRAVNESGGRAVLIPEHDPGTDVLDHLDGIVFAGGADVQPSLYGNESPHERTYVRPARDASEVVLIREATTRDMPVLAICRGMQLLAVAYGGRLHQHLPDALGHERHRPFDGPHFGEHEVLFTSGSKVAAMLGPSATVNSMHHQGVADVGGLRVAGVVPGDTLVEAVEDPAKRFVVGVQWHPEEMTDRRLFAGLVGAAAVARV
jgi:putative glutamine amidotransferase